jgi:hypothetical protein
MIRFDKPKETNPFPHMVKPSLSQSRIEKRSSASKIVTYSFPRPQGVIILEGINDEYGPGIDRQPI